MPQRPSDQLSDSQLKQAYWYVTHRRGLRQAYIIFLIILNVLAWGWGIVYAVNTFIIHQDEHEALMAEFSRNYVNYADFKAKDQPQRLQVVGVSVIDAGTDRYDFLANIRNVNSQWMGFIEYNFSAPGVTTDTKEAFLLPGKEKTLVSLGHETTSRIANARINIESIRWKKVLSFDTVFDEVMKFDITDANFNAPSALQIGGEIPISRLEFVLENNSAYNFWNVKLIPILFSGTRPIGVTEIVAESVNAGEKRLIETSWFNSLPNVTDVDVIVDLNILDEDNYRAFSAEPELDIRDYFLQRKRR